MVWKWASIHSSLDSQLTNLDSILKNFFESPQKICESVSCSLFQKGLVILGLLRRWVKQRTTSWWKLKTIFQFMCIINYKTNWRHFHLVFLNLCFTPNSFFMSICNTFILVCNTCVCPDNSKLLLHYFIIQNFPGKHMCWSFFLIKLQAFRPATLLQRDSNLGVFLWTQRNV